MSRLSVFLVLGLAACEVSDTPQLAAFGSGDMQGWRLATGKRPTRAEYAAVVAACQNGAVMRSQGKALDACLADLGLRRD